MKACKNRLASDMQIFRGVSIPWIVLILVLLVSMVKSQLFVRQATLTADIIDGTQQAVNTAKLVEFVTVTAGYALVNILIIVLGGFAYQKINLGVRNKLWDKLMKLPTRYYDGENGDALVSRVTTDTSQSYVYFRVLIDLVTAVYAAVVAYLQMRKFSPVLSRYMLFLIPVLLLMAWVFGKVNYIAGQKGQSTFSKTLAYLVERTRNLRLVKAARMEAEEEKQGRFLFHNQFRAGIWSIFSNSSSVLLMELLAGASIAITFLAGRGLVQSGEITIGRLLGFYTISSMMVGRIIELLLLYGTFRQGNGRLAKIAEILNAPEETQEGMEFDTTDADITVDHVSFSYPDRPALKDVSFTIPKSKITAIIGANGAGKSTMFKLLERMYDPDGGSIRFGEEDVRKYSVRSWRESFAIVSQDKPLLSGTVRENILYGTRRKVSEEELEYVAKQAGVYDFVMATPAGFDAQVGMAGGNFSGGQRQCIAIARAMMRNPDYLLLDEATSNLDANSEQLVSKALSNLMKGRTTVMIAHNYSATREADHIVVMKDGRVEAEGTPEELLQTNEYYRSFAGEAI
ncbi:MAG: ABC transporter ATP-binding protein [Lachnospiraceae bacterium]|nr:ABC transporter ATP-binding protein [Lachnospiraceae bacterium]